MSNIAAISETEKPSSEAHQKTPILREQDIVEKIYIAVLEQRLPPNTKLSEPKLCESLGVGRMKVRRALLLLADQGIVDLRSNRGAFIACPSSDDSEDIFGARLALEPNIAHQVVAVAEEKDYAKLEELISLEQNAFNRGERSEAIRLSGEFHVQIAATTGNNVLTKMVRELVTRTSLIVGMFGSASTASCPEHEHPEILESLRRGDAVKASDLMRQHLEHIEKSLDLSTSNDKKIDFSSILGDK
jgi:DNA-binding GntR family transcriptional regulator